MASVIGIDFGTSNSVVSSVVDGRNQVIPDERGNRITPSVVSFGKNKQILIGEDARVQSIKNPARTVQSIKRLIGRKFFSSEVKKSQVLLSYELVEGENQNVAIKIDGEEHPPQEIAALIIKHMKEIAEKGLGEPVTKCVITVPAYFNDNQRLATKEACEIAGLETLRIINEPTAAALAYGFGKGKKETIIVYDLGGGTFDVSVLRLRDKVFEVISTAGDTFLGGDDFDDRIIDLLAEDFISKHQTDLRKIPQALPLLRTNAEKTKRRLSYAERSDIYIPSIIQKDGKSLDLHFTLSRDQLKEKTKDLIQHTFQVCDEALQAASLKTDQIDAVILVGGPTKMPLIVEAVESYFGQKPLNDLNPDEVVSIGASIQAQSLVADGAQKEALLIDVTPLDLGIATVDGYVETLIEKNSPIPTEASKTFSTTVDNQEKVDIRIFQGKNRREEESSLLGEFRLSGFSKKKAGQVDIEVSFAINTDGIVKVSAIEKETGVAQNVSVRLSAAMGKDGIKKSTAKTTDYQEVRLKDSFEGATKVLLYCCGESLSSVEILEGYIPNFSPDANEFTLVSDMKNEKEKIIKKSQVAWLCSVSDFANIPRYLDAIQNKPSSFEASPAENIYEFTLVNGEKIYALSKQTEKNDTGFWVTPYFANDKLDGEIYIYSSKLKNLAPAVVR